MLNANKGDMLYENMVSTWEERRRAAGITRRTMADTVGIHSQTVYKIERGAITPSAPIFLAIELCLKEAGQPSMALKKLFTS